MAEGQTPARLDSWKAIADYLNRDVRTARRWEQTMGLPVRRLPGRRGHSVFAYPSEIDAWLKSTDMTAASATAESVPVSTTAEGSRKEWRRWTVIPVAALALAFVAWRIGRPHAAVNTLHFQATPSQIIAATPAGTELWHYSFPSDEDTSLPDGSTPVMSPDGRTVFVLVGGRQGVADKIERGGQFLGIVDGKLERSLMLTDQFLYPQSSLGPPWSMTAFRVNRFNAGKSIAVTAHVRTWWSSLVTLVDDRFERHGTFVNAGWILGLEWTAADRLVVSGISNSEEAGFVALIDANAINGQSPVTDRKFECQNCGHDPAVLRYVVFPRSELNLVMGSTHNEAHVEWTGKAVRISTIEVETKLENLVDAVYELTPALDVTRASFSDRYWDLHRALETEGKLTHSRAQCPDRDGPQTVKVWDPINGWRTMSTRSAKKQLQ